ncbi:allantoinase AllB [Gracilibacillus lacisalsi]|uniref:allantoinase AllB n=1 Tax=Gracilibacillus lacisalsi TaxID=393087 RepID=UPI00035CAED9|nr:allantoinase AllB [Gracilibacillus lacisalsi]
MSNHLDLVIKNGKVVFPDGVKTKDIGVKAGKITAIDDQINLPATQVDNAQGLYIFPGAIDVHVHFNEPGREDWEGFTTGSYMLAAGGYTSYFDMPLNGIPSTTNLRAFQEKNELAKKKSVIDHYLWGGLVPGNIEDLSNLASAGVVGFKAFISDSGNEEFSAVDDDTLIQGMKEIARLDKILALHAESRTITNFLTAEKIAQQKLSADDYLTSRPIVAEVEAVHKALTYAEVTGCPLHFVHISSPQAVEKIREAKRKGIDVTVETCPHYLLYSHSALQTKGAVAKCSPPLRLEKERKQLIQLLCDNEFDIIASDHSPAPFALKDPVTHDIFSAWGGISGGQFTLLSMLELVKKHNISLEIIADWTALNPAKRFSLDGKGKIDIGYDADFAIISLDKETVVSPYNYYAKHKHSLYEDHCFPCSVLRTYNRGNVVFDESKVRTTSC